MEHKCSDSQCDENVTTPRGFQSHQQSHGRKRRSKKNHCEKQSGSDGASSEPCGHRPSGEQDCCQQGGSSFTTAADLRRQQTIQRRQKSFSCGHCEKSFPSAGQRTLHERVHTEEQLGRGTSRPAAQKPSHPEYELFHCYRCAAVFVSASALSKHQQGHQEQEEFPT
ncbi:uncharacterized protein PAE49_007586 [Odontesthes bonariensis]